MLLVRALFVHPLKSAAGLRVAEAAIDALGFAGDRRWMAVDANGAFLSQRRIPAMATIDATPLPGGDLCLSATGIASLCVRRPADDAAEWQAVVWHDQVRALDGGEEAAEWLTTVLGCKARLVYCPPARARLVDPAFVGGEARVGFADGFPLLIVGQSSIEDINTRLRDRGERDIGAERFRPNIVIEGATPFEEDTWRQISIGDGADVVVVDVVKPCARCSIISVDPRSGVQGVEPMRTLATYRRRGSDVYVGQNALARTPGRVRTGATVRVVARV